MMTKGIEATQTQREKKALKKKKKQFYVLYISFFFTFFLKETERLFESISLMVP
jgi:hypothetical protein